MSFLLRSQRVCNQRFKNATGWAPRIPDATAGLRILRTPDRWPQRPAGRS